MNDGDFLARIRNVDDDFRHVRIAILALIEDGRELPCVQPDPNLVLALRNAGDVDPLADELLVVPVAPATGDAVIVAVIAVALAAVFVFERVLETKPLLRACDNDVTLEVDQFIDREVVDVVMPVSPVEHEVSRVRVIRFDDIDHHQISVAAIHEYSVESQKTPVAGAANRPLGNGAVGRFKKSIDDLHLGREALRVHHDVRPAAVVIDGIVACHAGALGRADCGREKQRREGHENAKRDCS